MEIVFVASEMTPFAQTGGLADVVGALPHEIAKENHSVSVFLPKYKVISDTKFKLDCVFDSLNIPVGTEIETGKLWATKLGDVNIFFLDQPEYFGRDGLYGTPLGDYNDNDARFVFFQRGVLESLKKLKLSPDVIHCHDWQTGLLPVFLKTLYRSDPFFKNTKTVFTIHNLAYQGNFPPDSISTTGLSWNEYRYDRLEFYGKISFLKGGLVYSDFLTTVSKRYAQEIQTKEFGCGMEGVLSYRKDDLIGILNGIDVKEWDPSRDPALVQNFDKTTLDKRIACKLALQKENGLTENPNIPLFGFVGRLTHQKGLDLIEPIIEDMVDNDWQLVLLGTGEEQYHQRLKEAAHKYPKNVSVNLTFDTKMSKRVYSGVDIFLMTSQFEPCGLGQMYAFRYGAIPLVREVGGLADTVQNFNSETSKGDGFVFLDYSPKTLLDTMKRAVLIQQDKRRWTKLVKTGMGLDFSWHASAKHYIEVYARVEKRQMQS